MPLLQGVSLFMSDSLSRNTESCYKSDYSLLLLCKIRSISELGTSVLPWLSERSFLKMYQLPIGFGGRSHCTIYSSILRKEFLRHQEEPFVRISLHSYQLQLLKGAVYFCIVSWRDFLCPPLLSAGFKCSKSMSLHKIIVKIEMQGYLKKIRMDDSYVKMLRRR